MAVNDTITEAVNNSGVLLGDVIVELGKWGKWIQALGLVVVLWLVFQIVALIVNRKKRKTLYKIRDDLQRLEKKVDKLLDRKKK
tara:strand:+ start:346 stop:597 length:252 start_codon:yes stop_codon:yes gene_type:complete